MSTYQCTRIDTCTLFLWMNLFFLLYWAHHSSRSERFPEWNPIWHFLGNEVMKEECSWPLRPRRRPVRGSGAGARTGQTWAAQPKKCRQRDAVMAAIKLHWGTGARGRQKNKNKDFLRIKYCFLRKHLKVPQKSLNPSRRICATFVGKSLLV